MRVLDSIARRCFRGRAFASLLESCDIEPRRYWLLVDLFHTLGSRGEVARMGNQDYSLRFLVIFWFFLASLIGLIMVFTGTDPEWYLLVFLGITVFNLSILLVPEAAENLVNPVEGLILAHQPVNGATWSAAKLTHLVKAVAYGNDFKAVAWFFTTPDSSFRPFAAGIQHLLFRSTVTVALVTLIVGAGARILTPAVLDDFAARIRLQLRQAASGSVLLYKEVE